MLYKENAEGKSVGGGATILEEWSLIILGILCPQNSSGAKGLLFWIL